MVINRLPVRADEVDILGCQPGLENGGDAGMRKDVSHFDVQLGDPADIKPLDIKNPAPDLGVVWLFAIMEQLDRGSRIDRRAGSPLPLIRQIATSIESALVPEIMPTTIRLCFRVKSSRCWAIGFIRFDPSLHGQTKFTPVFRLCNIR